MKKFWVFLVPIISLVGFLFIKPPAISNESKVVVTPTSTTTPKPEPRLRDFDDEGNEPSHSEEGRLKPNLSNLEDDEDDHEEEDHDEDEEDDD